MEIINPKFTLFIRRWLVKRGRDNEALAVLTRISTRDSRKALDIPQQLKELQAKTTADLEQSCSLLFKELFYLRYRYMLNRYVFPWI